MFFLIFFLLIFNLPNDLWAAGLEDPLAESGKVICRIHDTQQKRSELSYALEKITQGDKVNYRLLTLGKGDFDVYKNVSWEMSSQIELNKGVLRPLSTVCTIKSLDGQTLTIWENKYDHQRLKIEVKISETRGKKTVKKFTFPVKGRTADYATLNVFVKSFIPHLGEKGFESFYLLTSEPKLYKVNLKPLGEEDLTLPAGKFRAIKLRLIADMGILDEMFDKMVPPTFLWYEKVAPHRWLKYQGMETGLGSTYIEGYLNK